ncbi:MAG TPA: nitroreductase family deazaflavin-dependent oxidoreductase [Thermomicrobiales bacterium]|nr:nitroreductase family deazaflavin-dependent oxidoreductase [Thermomicrobiales bacterium]
MSAVPTTNAEVISLFRRNNGLVPSPYEDDPPPMIIMHTIGARSGKEHLAPLRAIPAGDDLIVFGSAHGKTTHPDWYYNMKAHPDFTIEIGAETRTVHAVEVTGEERDRLFAVHKARYPIFAEYEQRLERTIPVMRLERVRGA